MPVVLDKPRWPGGPLVCPVANALAFESEKVAGDWRDKNAPACKVRSRVGKDGKKVTAQWLCEHCGHWHFDSQAPDPAGMSSGNGRGDSGAPLGFVPFQRPATKAFIASGRTSSKSTVQESFKETTPKVEEWKGPFCVKCDSPVKSGKCVNKECVSHQNISPLPTRQPQTERSLF